jgi:DNA invertase Pin-like site-specific DNA recombinase
LPYASRHDYSVVGEFCDEGVAGDEFEKRSGFQQLLKAAQRGEFGIILVDEPSRLSRQDPIDFIVKVVEPLRKAGVLVDTVSAGPLDYESLAGIILSVVHADKASGETKNLSRRVLTGLLNKALAGSWTGGIVPYALRRVRGEDGKSILILGDEEEVRVVRWIFDRIANHSWTCRMVCAELHKRGVLPPRGNGHGRHKKEALWNPSTIQRMIRNRKYVGDMTWNSIHQGKHSEYVGGNVIQGPRKGKRGGRHGKDDIVLVENRIEPLINRDTFRRAAEALGSNKASTSPKKPGEGRHLFTHMLVCGHCGSYMVGGTYANGTKVYVCSSYDRHGKARCTRNTVREEVLRDLLVGAIRRQYLNPDRLDDLEREMRRQLEEDRSSGEADTIRRRLDEIDGDLDQAGVNMARAKSQAALDGIETAVRNWREEKDRLTKRLGDLKDSDVRIEEVIGEAKRQLWQLRESIQSADPSLVRSVLREIVVKVELFFRIRQAGRLTRCELERGIVLSMMRASPGRASQIRTPVTLVAVGFHGPANSLGAPGLRSNRSW